MAEVYITRTSHFLPNDPVSNDEMEHFLGCIGEQASKSRRVVLRNNGKTTAVPSCSKNLLYWAKEPLCRAPKSYC